MKQLYYIHSPDDWSSIDVEAISKSLEDLGLKQSEEAAIGEGAGGAGFETVVEVVLSNPIVSGLVSTIIFEIIKVLWNKRPKRKQLPRGLPEQLDSYRLVVHVEDEGQTTIIGVDLKSDIKDIETAVTTKLDNKLKEKISRVYQNGGDWDVS